MAPCSSFSYPDPFVYHLHITSKSYTFHLYKSSPASLNLLFCTTIPIHLFLGTSFAACLLQLSTTDNHNTAAPSLKSAMSNQASAEYCLRLQYNGNCMEAEQICPQLDVASTCANIRDQEPNTMSALPHPRSQVASAGTACIPPHLRTKAGSASVSAVSRQEVYNGSVSFQLV